MKNNDIIDKKKCIEELESISTFNCLYKYINFGGGQEMLRHHNIQFTRADKLNDEWDCNWDIISATCDKEKEIISTLKHYLTFGVCSLSTSSDNPKLWSDKYASSKGMCIGLNTKKLMEYLVCRGFAQPPFIVKYMTNIKDVIACNKLKNGNVEYITDFFRIKDIKWKEENEIRFVSCNSLIKEYNRLELPKECFESIHFGRDITSVQIESIKKITSTVGLDINIS